ncbi:hypothetical protein ACFOUV_01510 [Oceanobacillus longus]|uniref:DUF4367 domain-containing protein n=1 Tax=Oceanobacillus longus TaxID=930120 RepID=A0ABV8GRN1_9BACI
MRNPIFILAGLIGLIIVLNGCGLKSEEDALAGAKATAENIFHNESQIETNYELGNNTIYIPEYLEIESSDESNLILVNGDQTYILFRNPIETSQSELNFHAANAENALLLDSFSNEDNFGYIRILPDEGEGYEMQIGVGGVKITTFTTKGKMDADAEELMKMAKSIVM